MKFRIIFLCSRKPQLGNRGSPVQQKRFPMKTRFRVGQEAHLCAIRSTQTEMSIFGARVSAACAKMSSARGVRVDEPRRDGDVPRPQLFEVRIDLDPMNTDVGHYTSRRHNVFACNERRFKRHDDARDLRKQVPSYSSLGIVPAIQQLGGW
jgi:hypothetical protein